MKTTVFQSLTLLALAGCGGAGTVTFTTWGEAYIEDKIPVDSAATTGFVDGWSLKYSKFVLVYKDIALAQKTGATGPKQTGALAVDLTKTGPTNLLSFASTASGKWDRVSYAIAFDANAAPAGSIAAADVDHMKSQGLSLWVEGAATKDTTTKTFSWSFAQDTLFEDCTNPDFGEGVTIPNGGTEVVQLTTHGDHLWYDDLEAASAKLRFEAMAAADTNSDDVVTLDELAAVQLTAFPVGQYGTGGAGSVKTLKDFVSALARTVGHYRGEGECSPKVRQ